MWYYKLRRGEEPENTKGRKLISKVKGNVWKNKGAPPPFFKTLFVHERHGGRLRHRQREKQSLCRELDVGGTQSQDPGVTP